MHGRKLLKNVIPPEVERAIREFASEFGAAIDPLREDVVDAIEDGAINPSSTSSVRVEVERLAGNYTNDLQVVYRDGLERGAEAGRASAARRHQLDIDFEIVPQDVLDEFDDWAEEIVDQEVLKTITDESTRYIRAAHEDGLSIDDIAEQVNDELFEGRLQDHVAERNARTSVISSSNAGSHSGYADADSVVGEEWLATGDDRTRDSHAAADGQIVAVGNTFLLGSGVEVRYPGDPQAPIEEIVNERCTIVPTLRDELTDEEYATLQSGGRLNAPD